MSSISPKNPAETLDLQLETLKELVLHQKAQLQTIQAQNEKLSALIGITDGIFEEDALVHVKIEDINMPFWALVGFLIKVSIASIPAAIMVMLLTLGVFAIISVVFGGFFGILRGLL